MNQSQAQRKYDKLREIRGERGEGEHEAATAGRLALALARQYGLSDAAPGAPAREEFDARFRRAEARAAYTYAWEYRTCGKPRCRCMRVGYRHGPYKYSKRREGKKVVSIYRGFQGRDS